MPLVEGEKVSTEYWQEYWSGVGMLLYLGKHLHRDFANVTREFPKASNPANLVAFKELL